MKETTKLKLVAIMIMGMSSGLITINLLGMLTVGSITFLPAIAVLVNLVGYGVGFNLLLKTLRLEDTLRMVEQSRKILEETIKNLKK